VAQVELARAAVADLDELVRTHSLPHDTRERVRSCLEPLRQFPRLGPELAGRWEGFRFILGPWRWMLLVYVFDEDRDRVVVVTVQDATTSTAATGK
jgi:plasmid stabilization system protein ParE